MEADRISNLPGSVIDHILSNLPMREAVKTSVLSSKWRYKWATLPHLAFDNQCFSVSFQDHAVVQNKLVAIVDHVLLLHNGPIYKFKLSHPDVQGIPDINRWILHLSRSSIKELVLEIGKGKRYKMPSSLFYCHDLIHLKSSNCLLKPPLAFKGFRSLKSLDLQHVTMAQDVFGSLISSCPLLERLTLMNFDGFTHLNIDAPNLQFFYTGGAFEDISFENASCLTVISIGLYVNVGNKRRAYSTYSNLLKFFGRLPHIRRLEVQSYFLKYLAVGIVPGKLPTPCVHLNYFSICMNFNDVEEVLTALCLLRSSPNLKELEVLARPEEQVAAVTFTNYWKDDHWSTSPFDKLRQVKIGGILGIKPELNFINFLLLAAPVLETISVKPASNRGGWELTKELLRYRRSSRQAEIIYLDP